MNITHDNDDYRQLKDSVVSAVIAQFKKRSEVGMKKYNKTLDRGDLSISEWLQHLQEELMDATLYVEKLKREINNGHIRGEGAT